MAELNVFVAFPDDLFAEATELARMKGYSLSDLIVEALSESVESHQRCGWIAERARSSAERSMLVGMEQHQRPVRLRL